MGLSTSLGIALSGLRLTEANLDLVARNVANAGTPGYSKKTLQPVESLTGDAVSGVRIGNVTRDVNAFLVQQLRTEISQGASADLLGNVLSRLDQIYGSPGQGNALDVVLNEFNSSLQALATSPEQVGSREAVLNRAQTLADHLNRLSDDIQTLRRESEATIAESVLEVNDILGKIARLNQEVLTVSNLGASTADLEDQRDNFVNQLSQFIDVRTTESEAGIMKVFTSGGNLLVDTEAGVLSFDEHSGINPLTTYSDNPVERLVGTLTLQKAGPAIDLFASNSLRSGRIATLKSLRDDILVDAQAQLDELAHGLATALSMVDVSGAAVTVGVEEGFDLDVAGLLSGNSISVSFTDTPPGTEQTYTFIRVDDPSVLPLSNGDTAQTGDTVIGIDFSGGLAAAVAAMDAALGANITVSSPAADTIRILDDGAAGLSDIGAVSATTTTTVTTDNGLALPLFLDSTSGASVYTGSFDGPGQKVGFAQRMQVNPDIISDPALLVTYSTSPATGQGDPARPFEMIARLSDQPFTFSPVRGIGTTSQPFQGSIADFAQRIVSFQGQQANAALEAAEAQTVVVDALQARHDSATEVNVDEELGFLLELQNAYGANARIMSVVQELMQLLLRI